MKQQFKKWMFVGAIIFFSTAVFAQSKTSSSSCVSDKGYWVLESNIHTPLNHIIRFYNNDHVLVYTEKLTGIKLNTDKKKVKMRLKRALETTMLSLEQNKNPEASKNFVSTLLK